MPRITIKAASSQRIRRPHPLGQSYPKKQSREANTKHQERREEIKAAVDEWYSYTVAKIDELADRFDKKPRYFYDYFFQGGAKMIFQRAKINPHNAFTSMKAADLRAEGETDNVISIQRDYKEEYDALTSEQKEDMVEEFRLLKDSSKTLRRPTARSRIQDVANTVRNIETLLDVLKDRAGVESFFCIVRNNAEYHLKPVWYFSSKELAEYMHVAVGKKWDAAMVASKLEAFAIAGCDVINLNRTSQQKANHMKREIRDLLSENLITITGNSKAVMQYANFQEGIVHRYGVDIVGWTHDKFENPSNLSNSLPPLRTLLDAIRDGTCKFIKLSPSERKACEMQYQADITSGKITIKKRKIRSDAGVKRKKSKSKSKKGKDKENDEDEGGDSDEEGMDGDEDRPRKHFKSSATVPSDDDDDED